VFSRVNNGVSFELFLDRELTMSVSQQAFVSIGSVLNWPAVTHPTVYVLESFMDPSGPEG
jgi:hypothetical protein